MSRAEILRGWKDRLAEWSSFGAQVDGERVCRQVIADIETLAALEAEESLSLTQASKEGGVSTRQLSRLIQQGALENVGRKNAPRVRRADIPRKCRKGVAESGSDGDSASHLTLSRKAINSKLPGRGRNGTQG